MDNLTEVITSTACHPTHCNLYAYSTSQGITTMSDLRVSARGTPCRSRNVRIHLGLVFASPEASLDSDVVDLLSTISFLKFTRMIVRRE